MHRKTHVLESRFSRLPGLKACNFIKKRIQHSCFPVNIAQFLRTAIFIEHLRWLPLNNYLHTRNTLESRKFRRCFYIPHILWLLLKPGPGPWTWTLKNLGPKKPGSWKTWNIYWIKKHVYFKELCLIKTMRNVVCCLKVRVLIDI